MNPPVGDADAAEFEAGGHPARNKNREKAGLLPSKERRSRRWHALGLTPLRDRVRGGGRKSDVFGAKKADLFSKRKKARERERATKGEEKAREDAALFLWRGRWVWGPRQGLRIRLKEFKHSKAKLDLSKAEYNFHHK